MLALIILGVVLALAVGAVTKVVTDRTSLTTGRITTVEFIVGATLCALLVIPVVTVTGVKIAQAQGLSFNEYRSGFETAATVTETVCTKDGPCVHEYDCDPYTVTETYTVSVPTTSSVSDGKGGSRTVTTYRSETRTRQVTKYHDCPYVEREYTYVVTDSLGERYVMGDHWFPANPDQHRWQGSALDLFSGFRGLPSVPTGEPPLWRQAKDRLDAGAPGGVTSVHRYTNYLLASQTTILRKYSEAISRYQAQGLMPVPTRGVHDFYRADKAVFVGPAPTGAPDLDTWQDTLARLNGALGEQRQGDLHLVVVTDPKVTNPDEYAAAIQAHWQSPAMGKNALSKNGIVLVVGSTDGRSITWARAFTGMPVGNEHLTVAVREYAPGTALTPQALLGTPQVTLTRDTTDPLRIKHSDGLMDRLLFAVSGGYERVHMADFDYLKTQVQPSTGQKATIVGFGLLAAVAVWVTLLAIGERTDHPLRRSTRVNSRANPRVWRTPQRSGQTPPRRAVRSQPRSTYRPR